MKPNVASAAVPLSSFLKTHCRLTAVILAGTKGSRLFPMTSSETPKHLLPVAGIPSILRLLETLVNFPEIVIAISPEDGQTKKVVENVAKLKDDKGDIWIFESSKNQKITLEVNKKSLLDFGFWFLVSDLSQRSWGRARATRCLPRLPRTRSPTHYSRSALPRRCQPFCAPSTRTREAPPTEPTRSPGRCPTRAASSSTTRL